MVSFSIINMFVLKQNKNYTLNKKTRLFFDNQAYSSKNDVELIKIKVQFQIVVSQNY